MSPLCCELLFLVLSQCNKHCKTHCSTLQHTATSVDLHLTIPQQIMSICLVIPTATQRSNVRVVCVGKRSVSLDMKHAVARLLLCNTLQHTATHHNTLQDPATQYTLQDTATHRHKMGRTHVVTHRLLAVHLSNPVYYSTPETRRCEERRCEERR